MEFNKLVFAGLAVGCLTAAAGGSYLAVRQNQASVGAESTNGAVVPGAAPRTSAPGTSAPIAPVTESEGVIAPEAAKPVRPELAEPVRRAPVVSSAPARASRAEARPAPAAPSRPSTR